MDADGQAEQENRGPANDAAVARRRLLKAAIGTGAAIAVYSAPKISVVPAYGLTSSNRSNGLCYGLGWSSNNPTGKGWMDVNDQQNMFGGVVSGPTTGPATDQGQGTATYTWSIATFNGIPAFTLTIVATGCVNNGTASWAVSGMPAGYCLKFYNSGRPHTKDFDPVNVCGSTANLTAPGNSQASPTTVGPVSGSVSISGQGTNGCIGSGQGKIKWVFDIVPC